MRIALPCSVGFFMFALMASYPSQAERSAAENMDVINDVQEYVERAREVVERAHEGDYGHLRSNQIKRIDNAQRTIEQIFSSKTGEVVLSEDEQIQLANAQEAINAIIRSDDKSRMICKKSPGIGTRIAKTECLTVAQREQRSENARRTMRAADDYCVPGEGSACGQ